MNRRTIIKRISILTGAAFIGGEIFIQYGCRPKNNNNATVFLSNDLIAVIDEIGESILPSTDTPGAKAVQIGKFIQKIVNDCYTLTNQSIFLNGLEEIQTEFEKKYSTSFLKGTKNQRDEFLTSLDSSMMQYKKSKKKEDPEHYFLMMKQLTILGYFTSEIGASQALHYIAVPGRYDGSYPYKKGDKAWATS